ncbi:hypothetical protein H6P81_017585 [Aristolochia fimbriata]|uniref:EF-hand domain-containing protein n=1 Tax=Aristolochia fimbriata TaxID=158543 RepID=A0AAV7E1G7_ARIFI|nr:hypothetical protein H6P81_017585 [Aristolochia fimbriata]
MSFRDLQRIFATLDRNGDGRLSTRRNRSFTLNKVGASRCGPRGVEGHAFGLELGFAGICRVLQVEHKKTEEDKGGDGSDGSIQGLLEEDGGGDCTRMITKFDTNSDGQLDFQEFKQMMLSQHSTIA